MVKLPIPDFVKAIASAFTQVVQTRFMQLLAKGKDFANAARTLAASSVSTTAPAFASATPAVGPPSRGGKAR